MKIFIIILCLILFFIIGCNSSRQNSSIKLVNTNFQKVPQNLFAEKNDSLLGTLLNLSSVKYCGENHNHFVDIIVKDKIDSLRKIGIKNILFYRDWFGKNVFNGYGKLIWRKNDKYLQYQYNFENYKGRYGISSIIKSESQKCEAFEFYVKNRIDTLTSIPKETELWMSHAADHFVYTNINGSEKCFNISGLNMIADSLHLKVQLINKLKIPSDEYFVLINEIRKTKNRN